MTLLDLVLIAGLVFLVVAAVAAWLDHRASAQRRQIEHRANEAEREIDEIGRQTQAAIWAEAQRRVRDKRTGG